MSTERIWAEKYRPRSLADYSFQSEELKTLVASFVEQKDIPHLLITGIQGTGKSALAQVLIAELGIDRGDVLKINASTENGVDTVRDKIQRFCSTFPMGRFKIVLSEEADGYSQNAQFSFRNIIDQYGDTVRFVFTANHEHKVTMPIKSRTQHIVVDAFDKDAITDRIAYILDAESIVVDDVEVVFEHINRYKPDLRKIIQSIQQSSTTGTLLSPSGNRQSDDFLDQWESIWKTNPTYESLRRLVPGVDTNNFENVYRIMYDNVEKVGDRPDTAVVAIAEHLYKSSFVSDQEINLHACIARIFC